MKNILLFILVVLLFTSCSRKEESKLEAYNAEAFAFQVDSGWELNGSARVRGFHQNESNESYSSRLSYNVGLVTSSNDTINNLAEGTINETQAEELSDLPIEVQLELDSTYKAGKYKLIFNVKDEISGSNTSVGKELELE